ncbi:UNVERIFIED_CONTAM: hypothetical protein GTU68_029309 [Idotea baltica]|nr:hypothetical protein [Idotea baltica]
MPFSLANLLMGYWVFGELWCELHSAIDVLLSTASINNICLISLDRYWSITHAVDYLKDRTPRKAAIMIVSVWVLSGLVSIPPLLGWKVDRAPEEFPKCTVGGAEDRRAGVERGTESRHSGTGLGGNRVSGFSSLSVREWQKTCSKTLNTKNINKQSERTHIYIISKQRTSTIHIFIYIIYYIYILYIYIYIIYMYS